MNSFVGWLTIAGLIPWTVALRANWHTSLRAATAWAGLAIVAWSVAYWIASESAAYVALVATGCAGIAVLGARRPGVGAWNFVVGAFFAVMILPLAEGLALGTTVQLGTIRTIFLAVVLGVTVTNYLPTRFGPAAGLTGLASGALLCGLAGVPIIWPDLYFAAATWMAWLCSLLPKAASEFDRTWLAFRDRFGALWGLRVREQFNRSAANAHWNLHLGWSGLRGGFEPAALDVLRALIQRHGPAND